MKRIVWAIDFQARPEKLYLPVLQTLRRYLSTGLYEVQPVFVLSVDAWVEHSKASGGFQSQIDELADQFEQWLEGLNIPHRKPGKLLVVHSLSVGEAVQKVIRFAKSINASLIAAGSHARKGVSRWVLGSFAETLVLMSRIPVLVASLRSLPTTTKSPLLVAADLMPSSKHVLQEVGNLAKATKAPVVLYHALQEALPIYDGVIPFPAVIPNGNFDRAQKSARLEKRKRMDNWADELNEMGVKTRILWDESPFGDVSSGIVAAAAKANAGVVVMASHKDSHAIPGSNCRKVLRQARLPVWVLRA